MAYIEHVTSVSLPAGADLRTHQFKFVSIDSNGAVVLTGNDGLAQGVLLNAPNTGEAAEVGISGILKVECASAISPGDRVGSAANGEAKEAATASADLGTALQTGADGRVISILFRK